MKHFVFAAGVLLMSATFIHAQEKTTPKVEVGVTYTFVRVNTQQDQNHINENGGSASVAYNLNKTFGLVADFGGYDNGNLDRRQFSYMFGPRLNWRMSRVVPYVQFLFGGTHEWGTLASTGESITRTGFATAAGGGIDINITRHIAVKPIQLEYYMTQLPHLSSGFDSVQNDLRYSAGVVFRFGSK